MRLVIQHENAVELNYMWLPTWLGENLQFKRDVDKRFNSEIVGQPLTDAFLDEINSKLLKFIAEKYPISGLFEYLDSLKFVDG
jgi:hypothetical protein